MNPHIKHFVFFSFISIIINISLFPQQLQRHEAITAYIYNFAKSVQWENETGINEFHFIVFGDDQNILSSMKDLARTKTLRDKNIVVSSVNAIDKLTDAQLVFLPKGYEKRFPEVFDKIDGNNILLITDGYEDKRLIMINFVETEGKTLRFEINKANIINQHIRIKEDLILLGGTEIDVAELYREGQQSLRRLQKHTESLEKNLSVLEKDIETHKKQIDRQLKVIQEQQRVVKEKIQQLKDRESELLTLNQKIAGSESKLNEQLKKIKQQQKILDTQGTDLDLQEEKLKQGLLQLEAQERKLVEQEKTIWEKGVTIEKQQNFLYLLGIILLLTLLLIFAVYHSYKQKRKLTRELERKVEERTIELNNSNEQLKNELTIRKRTEEEMTASRNLLNRILDSITDAFIALDRDWKITYINPEAARINEKNPEEFLRKTQWEEWPASVGTQVEQQYRKAMNERVPVHFEHCYIVGNNQELWLDFHAYPHEDGLVIFYRNITERKKIEEKLRRSEEQFRLISESVADMIVVLDLNGKRVYNNPSYKPILGDTNKLPGTDSFLDIHPEDRERIKEVFQQTVSSGEGQRAEYRLLSKSSEIHYIESHSSVIRDTKGNKVNVVVVSRDITERKKTEAELLKYQEKLEEMVRDRTTELEIAKDRAEIADRLKSAFLATMSHELRTPLNSIIGFTGILLREIAGPLNPEQKKQLLMAKGSASHLLALINDVLDISKIEAGELTVSMKEFDFSKSLNKVVNLVRPLAEKKELSLNLVMPFESLTVVSDERRIEQVLLNLINNSIKFTEKGSVIVDCSIPDKNIVTKIIDTGIGIKPEDLDKLFKPFSQVDTGITRNHEGTGLGLSISKKLTEKLGGTISVESEFGKGSVFTLTLPIII